jgi:branched-subunit amino acid transport protein AzlD
LKLKAYACSVLVAACVNEFAWWQAARGTGEQGAIRYVTTWPLVCMVVLGLHLAFRDRFLSAVCAAVAVMSSTTAGCSVYWLWTKFELQPGQDQCSKEWGVPMLLVSAAVALAVFWRWPHGKQR